MQKIFSNNVVFVLSKITTVETLSGKKWPDGKSGLKVMNKRDPAGRAWDGNINLMQK